MGLGGRQGGLRIRGEESGCGCHRQAGRPQERAQGDGLSTAAAIPPAEAVVEFWFGSAGAEGGPPRRREWFAAEPAFDRSIARRFGDLIEQALVGGPRGWGSGTRDRLARILLLDQFTRNAFRGTAKAFQGDPLALSEALALIDRQAELTLRPLERAFVYLPLEHAEDLALQERSVALFGALAAGHPQLADFARHAARHRDVIARFGRFPHRNDALGRCSSSAERAFLAGPGARF